MPVLSCSVAAEEVCSGLNEAVLASVSAVEKEGDSVVIVVDMIAVCLRER